MKKHIAIVFAAVAVVVVAAVLLIRSRSDSGAANADDRGVESSTIVMGDVEPAAEHKPAPVNPGSKKQPTEIPLDDMPAQLRMQVDAIQGDSEYKERPGMLYDLMHEASMEEVMELLALSERDGEYSEGFRMDMKMAAYERWYQFDRAAAIRAADASSLTDNLKHSRIEIMLDDWASTSPEAVLAFVQERGLTGLTVDHVYGAIARGSAENGDLAAINFALAQIEDEKLYVYGVKSAARRLQRDHAETFEDWMASLPPADQNVAIAESAWMLADKDIDRALERLASLEERAAEELTVTRARVVVKWADHAPAQAADWVVAQDLQGEVRETLFSNLMSVWLTKDQNAAIAWAEGLIEKGIIDDAFMSRVVGRM